MEINSKIQQDIDKLKIILLKLYDNISIHSKYRCAAALLYMAELFETNRVGGFNGARGAYALYEAYQSTQYTNKEISNTIIAAAQDVSDYIEARTNSMPLLQKYFDTNQQLFSELN